MRDRPLTPIEQGAATPGGYWCLPCHNANQTNTHHECAGPMIVGGRRVNCTCQEHRNG